MEKKRKNFWQTLSLSSSITNYSKQPLVTVHIDRTTNSTNLDYSRFFPHSNDSPWSRSTFFRLYSTSSSLDYHSQITHRPHQRLHLSLPTKIRSLVPLKRRIGKDFARTSSKPPFPSPSLRIPSYPITRWVLLITLDPDHYSEEEGEEHHPNPCNCFDRTLTRSLSLTLSQHSTRHSKPLLCRRWFGGGGRRRVQWGAGSNQYWIWTLDVREEGSYLLTDRKIVIPYRTNTTLKRSIKSCISRGWNRIEFVDSLRGWGKEEIDSVRWMVLPEHENRIGIIIQLSTKGEQNEMMKEKKFEDLRNKW